jgi:hypothetical protein
MFPTSLKIELHDNPTKAVLYRGGFGDVSRRHYRGREVAVKTLRICTTSDLQTIIHVGCWQLSVSCAIIDRIAQRFCKEFVSWKALRHPNVLPLVGVIMTEDEFAMVSDWMSNGNINQFVREHQDANRFELVSFLYGVT